MESTDGATVWTAGAQAALVVAHPGHELRVYGWLEHARPRVFILTDGSGGAGPSRVPSTTRLLGRVGATPGEIYGRFSDREIYAAMLDGRVDLFTALATELAGLFARHAIDWVVGDAAQGYNPTHDACRFVADAAVAIVMRTHGRSIVTCDFSPTGRPDVAPGPGETVRLVLEPAAFARKLAAATDYDGLDAEVSTAIAAFGRESFRVECLRRLSSAGVTRPCFEGPPQYDAWGEWLVAAGHYERAIRHREHVLPIAEALQALVLRAS